MFQLRTGCLSGPIAPYDGSLERVVILHKAMVDHIFMYIDSSKIRFLEKRIGEVTELCLPRHILCLRRKPELHYPEAQAFQRGDSILRFWKMFSRRPIIVSQVTKQAMSAPTVVVRCSHIMLASNMPRSLILGA